jgi:hypothetical protein
MPLRRALVDHKRVRDDFPDDLVAFARRTFVLNSLSLASTCFARDLYLLKDARGEHVFLDLHSLAVTHITRIDLPVRTARAVALVANLLFLQLEFRRMAVVEILQGDANADLHIGSPSLTLVSKVPTTATAKEARKQIERVMAPAALATLFALLEPFMPVLVVDLAGLGVGKGFVGFGHLNELLLCFVVSTDGGVSKLC